MRNTIEMLVELRESSKNWVGWVRNELVIHETDERVVVVVIVGVWF